MKKFKSTLVFCISLLFFTMLFFACNDNAPTEDPMNAAQKAETDVDSPPAADAAQTAPASEGKAVSGWKQVNYEDFTFMIPADWKRESNTDIWFPKTESFDMGLPLISLQCGLMPIMAGQTVDEQIKEMIHGSAPKSKTAVDKCNMSGHTWEAHDDLSHMTLTLEDPRGEMIAVYFFNCRVPRNQFTNYKEIYRKILDSVQCN
ncbi:MAG TPA: hypothetical protein ENN40_04025 [Candidatus Aminicenantes bacterium]|nr:hypothetical protein [Candidatus Aminicenantes bacterium]